MEFASNAITVWFFPRGSIPSDISSASPNPAGWAKPLAQFQGGCNIPQYFNSQQIVFDLTFCGQWAGAVWGSSSCSSLASTCNAYVQNNPSAFKSAYWSVNSLRVYQNNGAVSNVATSGWTTSSTSATSSGFVTTTSTSVHSSSSASTTSSVSISASPIINHSTTIVGAGNSTTGEGPTATGSHIIGSALTTSQAGLSTPAPAPTTSIAPSVSATSTSTATDEEGRTWTWYWQHGAPTHAPTQTQNAKRQLGRYQRREMDEQH